MVNGLRSGVTYTIRMWAVNLKGVASAKNETSFTTLTNGGQKMRVLVSFDSVLENRQINKIACFLAVRYRLPFENVKDFLGYSCNEHRSRTSYPIDTILSSQYRIAQQTTSGGAPYTYAFYIYPLAFSSYDDTKTTIQNDVLPSNSSLKNDMTTKLIATWVFLTKPNIVGDIAAQVISSSAVDFVNAANIAISSFVVNSTNDTIGIWNLKLNQKGYIWVYALRKSSELTTFGDLFIPTKGEFKYYLNRRLSDRNYVAMRYYDDLSPVNIMFDGLNPNEDYVLYWFGQNDDAGYENMTSYMRSQYIRTQSSAERTLLSSVLVGMIVLIGLMM